MRLGLIGLVLCAGPWACGNNNNPPPPNDSGTTDTGSDGPVTNGTWTLVNSMAPANDPDPTNPRTGTISAFWFTSLTNGVVSFNNGSDGLIEHFSAPTTIDSIVLDGTGKLAGPTDDYYLGFLKTSLGLVVLNSDSSSLVVSPDNGKTYTYGAMYKTVSTTGNPQNYTPSGANLAWVGPDKANVWHLATQAGGGDVYSSPTAVGANATVTDTWHPEGIAPIPTTIPTADCASYLHIAHLTQSFTATTDGSALVYVSPQGNGVGTGTAGASSICRSTDGGKNFVDVSPNVTPSTFTSPNPPRGLMFTSATAGIAWYGSALDAAKTSYILFTTDGGTNWTVATLPAVAQNQIDLKAGWAAPSGTMFVAGGGNAASSGQQILFKSTDGGKTWSDLSANLAAWAGALGHQRDVIAGFAFDDKDLWIGSDDGLIAYSGTGGQ